MTEKVENEAFAPKKEQFEFILSVNGNIICQRYFRINGFKHEAYSSMELIEALDNCVAMIDKDLKEKTYDYYELTAPQVLNSINDLGAWCDAHAGERFIRPTYVIFHDSEDTYVWDGENATKFEKNFNRADYIADADNDAPCVLKFAFRDNGREVCSKIWDGKVYPRFIRTNIDLSNSKNKYRGDGLFFPVERAVIDSFINTQEDLIPLIVKELCGVCSYDDPSNYSTTMEFGKKEYDLSIRRANSKMYRQLENKYRKKTNDYFKNR